MPGKKRRRVESAVQACCVVVLGTVGCGGATSAQRPRSGDVTGGRDCTGLLVFDTPALEEAVREAIVGEDVDCGRSRGAYCVEQDKWRARVMRRKHLRSEDVQGVLAVDVSGGVKTLGGLECLPNLQRLRLRSTRVTDLTPLAALRSMEYLELFDTPVADLTPIKGLTQLESLRLTGTKVKNLGPLAGLQQLKELSLDSTAVTDLTPILGLPQLRRLHLERTSIRDLTPLLQLPGLTELGVDAGAIDCTEQAEVIWALRRRGVRPPGGDVALLSNCP